VILMKHGWTRKKTKSGGKVKSSKFKAHKS
jgi:hypothetical protein